jgi:signal transduction histidine kinase
VTRRNVLFDVLVAGAVLVVGQLEVWTSAGSTHHQGPHWVQALAYAVGALLLLARRVYPLGVLAGLVAVYVVEFAVVGSPEGFGVAVPPMVAAYSVARWEQRRPAWWGLVLLLVLGLAWIAFDPVPATAAERFRQAVWWSPWVIAWLVGALVRSRVVNAEQRRLRREAIATQAVTEERNRIARELHDVIGHSVSIMTVQASAVRRRLSDDQVSEREALETVETTGRQALAEMRRMVGVLRQSGEAADRAPAPGLTELPRLVEQFRSAGLPVEVAVTGRAQALAPGLDLTAYRLVQEALTNSLRHAVAPTRAEVSIGYDVEHLELAIRDDGQ